MRFITTHPCCQSNEVYRVLTHVVKAMRFIHEVDDWSTTTIEGPAMTYTTTTIAVHSGLSTSPSESQTARLPWA